jgi:uncharacterized protein (DUF1330 family)
MSAMSAFVISEVQIVDPAAADRYRDLAAASIVRHGGRYLVRAASPVVAEGEWDAQSRLVIAEFAGLRQLEEWYRSDDYAPALEIRQHALRRRLLFAEGVDS